MDGSQARSSLSWVGVVDPNSGNLKPPASSGADLEQHVSQSTPKMSTDNLSEAQLLHMAWHDPLTDLPNRTWLMNRLREAIARAKQQPDYQFAVLFLDCDRVKHVNDSLGHWVGDQLLIAMADRLKTIVPAKNSTLTRLSGDEFICLLETIEDIQAAEQIAQSIQQALTTPFLIDQKSIYITASIGIVLGTAVYDKPQQILRDADIAMYRAKALGKAQYKVFDTDIRQQASERWQLESDLRRAVENQNFLLHYQPIVSLNTRRIAGFEALIRWPHPEKGFVSPAKFIPIAEETGLIMDIGLWVLEEACRQLKQWRKEILFKADPASQRRHLGDYLKMSVNLSVQQFAQPDLIEQIDRILEETELEGRHLKLEITESVIMENAESATNLLQQLKARQIQLAIDDFGTGYSSLSYLHRFPVDTLKIDRLFIRGIGESNPNPANLQATLDIAHNLSIVQTAVHLAHNLGINVVAEGIETRQQLTQLRTLSCEFGQGYLFAPPLSREDATDLLEKAI
ncbi:MAG: bifunctional diguanylate cyclase/phosphodiesterase [Leptolyngbyaceae cyanobacterium MO_188.B28]|nr:bifunctional diguanylate cyclase/phosphodiesterase [Leptolyngbyaceae cyanobacterium MO_188.B28]